MILIISLNTLGVICLFILLFSEINTEKIICTQTGM